MNTHKDTKNQETFSYFKTDRVSSRVIRIIGITQELMYLVIGEDKAALIDTGIGVGNLLKFVKTLTDKPLIVLLTHGHLDHVGGATFFDQAYLNEKDWMIAQDDNTLKNRLDYLSIFNLDPLPQKDMAPIKRMTLLPMNHRDRFDLGQVTLECLEMPGHTQGSMTILIQEEKAILFGDACNPFTCLFDEGCSPVNVYQKTLEEFKIWESRYDRVLLSHGNGEVDKSILDGVIEVCREVLNGHTDDVPYDFMGTTHHIAKAIDPSYQRVDHGLGNLVYNKDRILG